MNDREKWRERASDIRASGYIYIYIYIYINRNKRVNVPNTNGHETCPDS